MNGKSRADIDQKIRTRRKESRVQTPYSKRALSPNEGDLSAVVGRALNLIIEDEGVAKECNIKDAPSERVFPLGITYDKQINRSVIYRARVTVDGKRKGATYNI